MIALKLIFQSLAGVGAVAACVGGAAYKISSNEESSPLTTTTSTTEYFYLVSLPTSTAEQPAKELWTPKAGASDQTLKSEKNYKCESGTGNDKKQDEGCELFSLNDSQSATTKIEISKIQEFIKNPKTTPPPTHPLVVKTLLKEKLKTKAFFLLKSNSEIYKDLSFDGSKTIVLISKETETNNTYATLNVYAKLTAQEITGKTAFIIAKAKDVATNAVITNGQSSFKCSFNSSESACSIKKLDNYKSSTQAFTFSTITFNATQTTSEVTVKDQYYLIKSDGLKTFDIKTLLNKELQYIETATTSKKTTTLIAENAIFPLSPIQNTLGEIIIA